MINFTSENILRFIKKFSDFGNQVIECFTKGNCFWFAMVLAMEFAGEIYYDPIVGHFATMIDGVMYDITGVVENTSDFVSIEEIRKDGLLWARLQRDCVDLGVGMEMDELISQDKLRLFAGSKFCPNCGKTMIKAKGDNKIKD